MPCADTQADLQKKVSRYLKSRIRRSSITYDELVRRLHAQGWPGETAGSIASKLSRGTFPATFFVSVLTALEEKQVRLEDLHGAQ